MTQVIPMFSKDGTRYNILVDDEDYSNLAQHKWHPHIVSGTVYARRGSGGKVSMHRQLLGLSTVDAELVDHQDGNGLNNQKYNLRKCTNKLNQANAVSRRGKSKYKGVHYKTARSIWVATICVNGLFGKHREFLGSFKSELDAAIAYNKRAIEVHGEFARLNVLEPV